MAREMTLAIVKPDAVKRNLIGEVIRRIEQSGLHRDARSCGADRLRPGVCHAW